MRYVLVLSLLMVGCGPSKLEVATKKCDDAMTLGDYDTAVIACKEVATINHLQGPSLERYLHATRLRNARDFRLSEEAIRQRDLAERQAFAAERAAAAAELQANTLSRAESKQR